MSEQETKRQLQDAFRAMERKPPSFDETWAMAEARHRASRRRLGVTGGIAAAVAIVALTVGLWPRQQAEMSDEFLIAESLMNSTSWSAPSDALMPEHQFDIYRDNPLMDRSTNTLEGTLL